MVVQLFQCLFYSFLSFYFSLVDPFLLSVFTVLFLHFCGNFLKTPFLLDYVAWLCNVFCSLLLGVHSRQF